jgi:His-Xaa-Ser system radical SAM maturase HxsC
VLALHTHAKVSGSFPAYPVKVLDLPEALATPLARNRVAARLPPDCSVDLGALAGLGFAGVIAGAAPRLSPPLPALHSAADPRVVDGGDVIQVRPDGSQVMVLFRRRSTSNSLFLTERCNSLCLMCSQPPRPIDDGWRIDELKQVVDLIDPSISSIGVTGGEPTLLGERLAELLAHVRQVLPDTQIHVLTNGRRFADRALVELFEGLQGWVTWGIPVYADVPSIHDHVVQARGAFFETLEGIYNLAAARHAIEVRYVLHKQTAARIGAFAEFASRNLPFVSHVAFMGLEPMGFAKMNRSLLWVDPADYVKDLDAAVEWLDRSGVATSIFNLPLCILPRGSWRFARQSISDWKRIYEPICDGCEVRDQCGGFFRSAGPDWQSRAISPVGGGNL